MADVRWNLIKEAHDSCMANTDKDVRWKESFPQLLDDLDDLFNKFGEKNTFSSTPSNKDQLLVLLTFYLNTVHKLNREQAHDYVSHLSISLVRIFTESDDLHTYSLASKCLCACLALERSTTDKLWYVQVLKPCCSKLRSGSDEGRVLDLFRYIFSKHFKPARTDVAQTTPSMQIEKIKKWTLQELIRVWRPLTEDIVSRFILDGSPSDQENPMLFSLLSLWSKLIKHHQKYLEDEDVSLSGDDNFAPLHTSTTILTESISEYETIPVIFDKICDVLNRTLLYGFGSEFQYGTGQGQGFQVDLAADVLKGVQRGLLEKVPLSAGTRHFGGLCVSPDVDGANPSVSSPSLPPPIDVNPNAGLNLRSFRKVVLLVTKACTLITRSAAYAGISLSAVELVLDTLWSWARDAFPKDTTQHWIMTVFGDQDDMLVEILLCFLDIHTTIKWKPSGIKKVSGVSQGGMTPHELFLHFLHHISFDHTLLLDLLTSPETCFLLYLVRYLHYAQNTWSDLSDTCLAWKLPFPEEEQTPRPSTLSQVTLLPENPLSPLGSVYKPSESVKSDSDFKSPKYDHPTSESPQKIGTSKTDMTKSETTYSNTDEPKRTPDEGPRMSSLKIVDYSDDSLSSDSDTEELPKETIGVPSDKYLNSPSDLGSPTGSNAETDALNSTKSDLCSSTTGSFTSLTSVTSELDMPSDLQDTDIETDVDEGTLDRMMTVLIRLRLVIDRLDKRGLFPYNASALRRILCQTESLYEGEDP